MSHCGSWMEVRASVIQLHGLIPDSTGAQCDAGMDGLLSLNVGAGGVQQVGRVEEGQCKSQECEHILVITNSENVPSPLRKTACAISFPQTRK